MSDKTETTVIDRHKAEVIDEPRPDVPQEQSVEAPMGAGNAPAEEAAVIEVTPPDEERYEPGPTKPEVAEAADPLFESDAAVKLRARWNDIQVAFVDEPRATVEKADSLVAETTKCLADSFAAERARLEDQWARGDNVSTEDLRVTLRRYRSFFNRLLEV